MTYPLYNFKCPKELVYVMSQSILGVRTSLDVNIKIVAMEFEGHLAYVSIRSGSAYFSV